MVDLLNLTFNKKILSEIVALSYNQVCCQTSSQKKKKKKDLLPNFKVILMACFLFIRFVCLFLFFWCEDLYSFKFCDWF